MKVYVVDTGEYSDCRVRAVFSSEQEADRISKLIGGNVLEPFELDAIELHDPPHDANGFYELEMKRNGDAVNVCEYSLLSDGTYGEDGVGRLHTEFATFRTQLDNTYERKSHWRLLIGRYAKNKEQVIKIAADLRRQILAGQRPECVDFGKN